MGRDDVGVWEDARYEPEKFTEAGQFVIVAVRAQARGRRIAVPMDVRMFHVFEMRDGKVQRMWGYLDEADALEAVGLRGRRIFDRPSLS